MGDKGVSAGAGGTAGRQRGEPPIQAAANITMTRADFSSGDKSSEAKEKQIFGREMTKEEYAILVGAQEGSSLKTFVSWDGFLSVEVKNPNIKGQVRQFKKDADGNVYIYNAFFETSSLAPPGYGTRVFTDQVKGARQMGIQTIKVTAAGDKYDTDFNGYYTWPRLGYDGKLNGAMYNAIPATIKQGMKGDTIQELYRTKEGRDWWKDSGSEISLSFDTNPNSISSRVLDAYNEERRNRK